MKFEYTEFVYGASNYNYKYYRIMTVTHRSTRLIYRNNISRVSIPPLPKWYTALSVPLTAVLWNGNLIA